MVSGAGYVFFQHEFMDICVVKIWKVTTVFIRKETEREKPKGPAAHYACNIFILRHDNNRRYKEVGWSVNVCATSGWSIQYCAGYDRYLVSLNN